MVGPMRVKNVVRRGKEHLRMTCSNCYTTELGCRRYHPSTGFAVCNNCYNYSLKNGVDRPLSLQLSLNKNDRRSFLCGYCGELLDEQYFFNRHSPTLYVCSPCSDDPLPRKPPKQLGYLNLKDIKATRKIDKLLGHQEEPKLDGKYISPERERVRKWVEGVLQAPVLENPPPNWSPPLPPEPHFQENPSSQNQMTTLTPMAITQNPSYDDATGIQPQNSAADSYSLNSSPPVIVPSFGGGLGQVTAVLPILDLTDADFL